MARRQNRAGGYRFGRENGNSKHFKDCARYLNRLFRARNRAILREINRGDLDAADRFERHIRHTAAWEAF